MFFLNMQRQQKTKGFKVIIAGAGMAAHLPGMCAAIFPDAGYRHSNAYTSLGGRDSLYSIVQMPSGIPVATVAINGGAMQEFLQQRYLQHQMKNFLKIKSLSAEN